MPFCKLRGHTQEVFPFQMRRILLLVMNFWSVQDGEDLFFAREALQGKLPKYVELLKFKVNSHTLFTARHHSWRSLHSNPFLQSDQASGLHPGSSTRESMPKLPDAYRLHFVVVAHDPRLCTFSCPTCTSLKASLDHCCMQPSNVL